MNTSTPLPFDTKPQRLADSMVSELRRRGQPANWKYLPIFRGKQSRRVGIVSLPQKISLLAVAEFFRDDRFSL